MIYGVAVTIAVLCSLSIASASSSARPPAEPARFTASVEAEEKVYSFTAADNGAGPTWSYGSSCIVRIGDQVFISGIETLPGVQPLNNVRWLLFSRSAGGWDVAAKGTGRTREPCPLGCFQDGSLFLSDNPTLTSPEAKNGPARPEVLEFSAKQPSSPPRLLIPSWDGTPEFTEHSYRSFAADAQNKELILFQNVGYTHSEWSFRDRDGKWSAHGQLKWPWGAEYPEPQPIRVCYPTVALKNRAAYFCGVSDIVEPYPQWRDYKREVTGREWDYDFRRLFFTWSDDVTTGKFHDWVEVSSRDKTSGWLMPNDLWVAPDGAVHLLWTERALDERMREKFFPNEKQTHALMYAVVRGGKVESKRPLAIGGEGESSEIPRDGRFQVTADGRLFVFYYVSGESADGKRVSENRIMQVLPNGAQSQSVTVPLTKPFTRFFTATWRAGSPPSETIDIYGNQAGADDILSYARIRIR